MLEDEWNGGGRYKRRIFMATSMHSQGQKPVRIELRRIWCGSAGGTEELGVREPRGHITYPRSRSLRLVFSHSPSGFCDEFLHGIVRGDSMDFTLKI